MMTEPNTTVDMKIDAPIRALSFVEIATENSKVHTKYASTRRPVARLNYGGGGSFGPKWNSSLRKWPLWLITFCWTDNLRFKYLDTGFISGVDGVYR